MKWNSYSDKIRHFRLTSSRGPSLGAIYTFSFHSEHCHVDFLNTTIEYSRCGHITVYASGIPCVLKSLFYFLYWTAIPSSKKSLSVWSAEAWVLPPSYVTGGIFNTFTIQLISNKQKKMEVVLHNKSLLGHAVFSWLISLGNYSATASDLKTAGILYVNTVLLSALCFISHDLPSDY